MNFLLFIIAGGIVNVLGLVLGRFIQHHNKAKIANNVTLVFLITIGYLINEYFFGGKHLGWVIGLSLSFFAGLKGNKSKS